MNAVWSFWTKPFNSNYNSTWLSRRHFAFSWILSVETARRHYQPTFLFTDDKGVEFLVEGIGVEVDYVSTELNALKNHDSDWWALGKILTYNIQKEPFIHIDNDVFLWKRLPLRLENAPVFAQNPEYFISGKSDCYTPEKIEAIIQKENRGWLPPEWLWYRAFCGDLQKGICCGIFGGNQVDFINHYSDTVIKIIEHPINKAIIAQIDNKSDYMALLEQFVLATFIDYHAFHTISCYKNINIEYLFEDVEEAFRCGDEKGFTHLIGGAKRNEFLMNRLEKRVMIDYPEHYDRCMKYLRDKRASNSL